MLSYQNFTESFNSPADIVWTRNTADDAIARFKITDSAGITLTYIVTFHALSTASANGPEVEVTFGIVNDSVFAATKQAREVERKQGLDLRYTGMIFAISETGNAMVVFASVLKAIREFMAKWAPNYLTFFAATDEPSRLRLYKKMVSSLGPQLKGYVVDRAGERNGYFRFKRMAS